MSHSAWKQQYKDRKQKMTRLKYCGGFILGFLWVYLVVFVKCGWLLTYMLVFLVKKRISVVVDAKFRGIIYKQQVEVKSRSDFSICVCICALDTECKSRERMKKEIEKEHNVSRSLSADAEV